MNKYLSITLIACAAGMFGAATGCENKPTIKVDESSNPNADNTKKNERDTSPAAVTPMDQAENPTDRAITQKVRQEVVKNGELSMNAKNVKIITNKGVVTLRGPVETAKERDAIAAVAKSVTDVNSVDNQLEVKNP